MKAIPHLSILAFLLAIAPNPCFALITIENVTRERAKELGMEIRSHAAGPDAVRIALEFEAKGALKDYSRVDLEMWDGGKLLISSSLREDKSNPGRVIVSFAADRANLDKITLRVVVQSAPRSMHGFDLRMKDFVDLDKIR